jgi:hypothetical protein
MTKNFDEQQNRRSYLRVQAQIPMEASLVTENQVPATKPCLPLTLDPSLPLPPPHAADANLMQWLDHLSKKMDLILNLLATNRQDKSCFSQVSCDLGGGGLSFVSDRPYQQGDLLELKFQLNSMSPLPACAYGRVIYTRPAENGFMVSLEFVNIDESLRDDIIRYVFEFERQLIRSQRR